MLLRWYKAVWVFAGEFVVLATDEPSKCQRGLDSKRCLESDLLTSFLNQTETKRLNAHWLTRKTFRFSSGSLFTAHFTLTSSRKWEDPDAAALQLTMLCTRPHLQACLCTSVADKLEVTRAGLLDSVQPPQSLQCLNTDLLQSLRPPSFQTDDVNC